MKPDLFQGSENHDHKVVDEAFIIRAKHAQSESKNRERKLNDFLSVSLVIPNWNGEALLEKNLRQVINASPGVKEIIVVDDASTDGSVGLIQKKFPEVKLIKKARHEGFSSTVNRGAEAVTGDILVLLNTDVVPEKGYLKPLINRFADPKVFAVGCEDRSRENGKVILRGRGEAAWKKGFFIHRRGEPDKEETAWVSGGSGAFRKNIWTALGGMDPLYNPFYWEDIDLSYRAVKSGYSVLFEPESKVNHYHETGKILINFSASQIARIAYRNQYIFIWKNLTDSAIWLEHLFWLPVRLIQAVFRRDFDMLIGFTQAVLLIPSIIKTRNGIKSKVRSDREAVKN